MVITAELTNIPVYLQTGVQVLESWRCLMLPLSG